MRQMNVTLPSHISTSDCCGVIDLSPLEGNPPYLTQSIFQAAVNAAVRPVECVTTDVIERKKKLSSSSSSPRSPYLNGKVREVVSDCALPISVVIFSFIGSYLFLDIKREYRSPTDSEDSQSHNLGTESFVRGRIFVSSEPSAQREF